MIADVSKTIKVILYERITSPLFGTFVLAWCGWNWRIIVLFLTDSSMAVIKKFQYLDTELYPSSSVSIIHGLLLPVITTLFFIYIYPWFARKVYGYWREQQNELKKLQVEKDGEKPLTKEEAQKITNQALLSELQYQEEREKREARIKDLESLIKSLQVKNDHDLDRTENISPSRDDNKSSLVPQQDEKLHQVNKFTPDIQKLMFSILMFIDRITSGNSIDKSNLMQEITNNENFKSVEVLLILHCLDNLIDGKFINRSASDRIMVLPKGRTALVSNSFDIE